MRILFLCDQKWRDLPGLVAIAVGLKKSGHQVLIFPTKDVRGIAALFRPDVVVFNHLFSTENVNFARILKRDGRGVVVLPTEGAVRPEYASIAAGEFSDYSTVDLYLAWSELAAADLRRRWGWNKTVVPSVGCTRFDFHHQRFRPLVNSRKKFCQAHALDAARPIVTWASAYAYANIHMNPSQLVQGQFEREAREVGIATCLERIGITLDEMPRLYAEARNKCAEAFFNAAEALPDVQFVLKPHPVEKTEYYQDYIRQRSLKNVRFCQTDYIWNILNASDIHLHRQCTTAVEAWMWDKPTVEMAMDYHPAWEWPQREQGSHQARSTNDLVDLIQSLVGASISADMSNHRREHIHTLFGQMDGRRSQSATALISALLERREPLPWTKPLRGLSESTGARLRTLVSYTLNRTPVESIISGRKSKAVGGLGSEDKFIRRSDVASYNGAISRLYETTT
jgi:surface carbohydrate biosynthesis protein